MLVRKSLGGAIYFTKDGKLHNEGNPAFIDTGVILWAEDNIIHRVGGPAVTVFKDNINVWVERGVVYRENGPAIVSDKYELWVADRRGQFNPTHHENIDALPYDDDDSQPIKVSFGSDLRLNIVLHREDGPAVTYSDGRTRYFINGKEITTDVALNQCARSK